jgi:hypothetical protein
MPLNGNEFRILTLHAGRRKEQLKCTLRKAVLTQGNIPPYETISYTWGSARSRDPVLINDRCLNVPVNTARALRCVRSSTEDRHLWIDFLCINQYDIGERSAQVAVMAKIYQWAGLNLVYLGDDGDKAKLAFANIEELADEAENESKAKNVLLPDMMFTKDGYFTFSDIPLRCSPNVELLDWIYQLPWFR